MRLYNPIAIGNTAAVYLHEGRIIKVFDKRLPDGEAQYEANKHRIAHASGLPVPEVYDVTYIDGNQAIVMEYVNGRTIGELMRENPSRVEYFMGLSVDLHRRMHCIAADATTSGMETTSAKLARQIQAANPLDDAVKHELLETMRNFRYYAVLCHGDFHINNIIVDDHNKAYIIDWVDASLGDPRADACRSYILYSKSFTELAAMYLDLYTKVSGVSVDEIMRWAPVIAAARLSEGVSAEHVAYLSALVDRRQK